MNEERQVISELVEVDEPLADARNMSKPLTFRWFSLVLGGFRCCFCMKSPRFGPETITWLHLGPGVGVNPKPAPLGLKLSLLAAAS